MRCLTSSRTAPLEMAPVSASSRFPRRRRFNRSAEIAWVVAGIQIIQAQWADRRHLRHVLARLRPVEVGRISRKNDHAAGRIRRHGPSVELIAQANIENAGNDRVDAILRMRMRHQLYAAGHFDPDDVRSGFRGVSDDDRKSDRGRECRKWLPSQSFGQRRFEDALAWLMGPTHFRTAFCAPTG